MFKGISLNHLPFLRINSSHEIINVKINSVSVFFSEAGSQGYCFQLKKWRYVCYPNEYLIHIANETWFRVRKS